MKAKNNIWKLYLLIMPFQTVLSFYYIGYLFQIPEIVLLFLFTFAWKNIKNVFHANYWNLIDIVVLLWPIVNIIPSIHNGFNIYNIIGIVRAIYIVGLYFTVRLIVDEYIVVKFHKMMVISASIAAFFGIAGWISYTFLGIQTPLIIVRPYPYFGYIAQVIAFTSCPNILASFLMIGIIFQFSLFLSDKKI